MIVNKAMEFKGTKGKWVLGSKRKGYQFIDCPDSSWYEMIRVVIEVSKKTSIEGNANAKLISCAPEMLEMLEKVRKKLNGNGFPMLQTEIEQLIKKATEL
jgi:hypothetical protein